VNAEAGEDLPSWLRETPAEPESSESLPDWLRETPATATPKSAMPQQEPVDETSDTTADEGEAESVPDWLRSLGDDQGTQPPAPASPAEGVPDWLLAMVEEAPAETIPAATTPDWLAETPAETSPTTPDWLRDEPTNVPAGNTADWLRDEPTNPPAATNTDWLSNTGDQPTTASAGGETGDITSWLQDISTEQVKAAMDEEDEPLNATPFSFDSLDQAGSTSPPEAASGPPSWLGSDSGEDNSTWFDPPPAVTPTPGPSDLADDDAPSWLSDAAPVGTNERTPNWLADVLPPTADGGNAPSWLDPTGVDTPQAGAESPGEAAIYEVPTEDVPAWLRGSTEPSTPEATPAWLDESNNTAPIPGEAGRSPEWLGAAEPSTTPPVGLPPIDATPDWLREAAIEPSTPVDEGLPTWLRNDTSASTQPAPISAEVSDPDLPPWLRDESGARLPTADEPGEQNLPPWLKGSAIGAANAEVPQLPPEPQPALPLDNWFDQDTSGDTAERVESVESDSEFLGGADLPAWLRPKEKKIAVGDAAEGRTLDWLTRLGSPEEEDAAPIAAAV